MTRPSKGAPWSQPINIGPPVNTRADETFPGITADGLELYFSEFYNYRNGGCGKSDIWVAKRPTTNDPWGEPVNLGPPVNTANHDSAPTITPDGLVMFIMRDKSAGGYGGLDIWMTKRTTRNDEWGKPVNVGPFINTDDNEDLPYISPDGSSLFFLRTGTGTWQAPILPVVDFNGDSQVDGKEVLTMTEYWGLDNSLCDIGPTPMGDGIVDLQDVIALVEYLGKEVHDSTLLAHWALDETEGLIASDSAGENDAFLNGNPIWQTESGMIDGAIELDGVDDCILTESFMDPADQPFSVLAWVKGGEPGQVIISQSGACDWLCINSSDGSLMSKLCRASWNVSPLYSDAVITDGQWHRVGFVWDGITRALYVDEQEVARDGHSELWSAENGLVIGGGAMSLAGTYFSGLIDDVRIYNRVVSP